MLKQVTLVVILLASLVSGQTLADSLWAGTKTETSLFTDTKAREIGDVITILIQEQFFASSEQDQNYKKESSTKFKVNLFRLFGYESPVTEPPAADWESNREHKGGGDYESKDKLVIRLTATVKELLPNGNLLIEGSRRLQTGRESRFVSIAGIVRPRDIGADNAVLSEKIADATISYKNDGPIVTSSNRGWGEHVIDFIWPF